MNWLKDRLIADCGNWWKRWSVRLAAAIGVLTTLLIANQGLVLSLIGFLPDHGFARVIIAVCIGIIVFVLPTITVLLKQSKLDG